MRKSIYGLLCCLVIAANSPASAKLPTGIPTSPFPGIVSYCHDADTCKIRTAYGEIDVRLAKVDAPEIRVPGKWPTQPHAFEAKAATNSLIARQTVTITPELTKTGEIEISWDRIVADI